jgi:hypothetical protein
MLVCHLLIMFHKQILEMVKNSEGYKSFNSKKIFARSTKAETIVHLNKGTIGTSKLVPKSV